MKNNHSLFVSTVCFLISVNITLLQAQNASISGKVVDDEGLPAIGATVAIKGTSTGTTTDLDGKYQLSDLDTGTYTLRFSYIGFATQEQTLQLSAGEQKTLDINLQEDALLLDQVVVVGYGTKVKRNISSAISSVSAEEIRDKPVHNFTSALQGKAAGVQITTDNGLAGSPTTMRIRGTKTLSSSAEPLYVIDGIPLLTNDISDAGNRLGYNTSPLSNINPNDIESIEILKDAAATSIYGARGANGVVLITTKSGKQNAAAMIDVNYNSGLSAASNRLKMLNGQQYADLYREAWDNDVADGLISPQKPFELPNNIPEDSIANTDWIDEVLRIGRYHDLNLSVSKGWKKVNTYFGGAIRDENTFLAGNKFQRMSFRNNLSYSPLKTLSMGYNMSISNTANKYALSGWAGGIGRAQSTALPIFPVYNDDNSFYAFTNETNPVQEITLLDNRNNSLRTLGNAFVDYEITPGLRFRNEFGLDLIDQKEYFFTPAGMGYRINEDGDSIVQAEDRNIKYTTWNLNTILSYSKALNENHDLEVMGGFNPNHTVEDYRYIKAIEFESDEPSPIENAQIVEIDTAGKGQEYSFASFFGRLNYEINKKYLFQVSFRLDGSSRFGANNKWGNFPSASFGWIISDEPFLFESRVLTFLKLRTSVGTVGNAEIGNFDQYSFFSIHQNYAGEAGIGPDNIASADLSWETTTKTDLGLDFGFWQNRISGTIELYYEETKDVLIKNFPLSPSSGFGSLPAKNIGKLSNQGIEVQITSNNINPKRKLKWKTDLNFSAYKNKVLDLGGLADVSGSNFGENRAIVGQPVGVFFIAESAGIDPETGQEMIYDLEGNIVPLDASNSVTERKPMGQPYPTFFGGIKNEFEFKNLGLEFLVVYAYGQKIYDDHGKRQVGNMGFGWNQDIRTLDRWQQPGDQTDVPKLSLNRNYDLNTSRHLHDASYIRLRNVTLYYNFPDNLLKKFKLRGMRIFLAGQNLYVLTPYKGWDPEVNRDSSGAITQSVTYLSPPQSRTISAGINLSL